MSYCEVRLQASVKGFSNGFLLSQFRKDFWKFFLNISAWNIVLTQYTSIFYLTVFGGKRLNSRTATSAGKIARKTRVSVFGCSETWKGTSNLMQKHKYLIHSQWKMILRFGVCKFHWNCLDMRKLEWMTKLVKLSIELNGFEGMWTPTTYFLENFQASFKDFFWHIRNLENKAFLFFFTWRNNKFWALSTAAAFWRRLWKACSRGYKTGSLKY